MRKWVSVLCAEVLVIALITGASTPVTAQGGGSIVGEVKFSGTPPAPKVTKVNKDNQVCGDEKRSEDVIVGQARTLYGVSDASGAFKLDNVPPGKHKVEVWHETLGTMTQEVEVKAGAPSKVTFELGKK